MRGYTKEELCLIWLDSFSGLEYKNKQTLITLAQGKLDATEIVSKGKDYILSNLSPAVYTTLKGALNVEYINLVLDSLQRKGVKVITCVSEGYPESLKNITMPPLVLYVMGNEKLLKESNAFAIVGSRKSLPLSVGIAQTYTKDLISAGFTIVTGIAQGIDETVLKTALDCKGKVISVIAGGFENVYPKTNLKLMQKVAKNGLVISEHSPETLSMPYMFPIRNRIFAGLSRGVLIISGAKKSGTLWTAEYAIEYGKDVFAIPYNVGISSGEGCNALIKQGAILTDSPSDITDYYGIEIQSKSNEELSPEQKAVMKILSDGEKHVEQISALLNKRAFEIMPILSVMEIKGLILKSGNVYQLKRSYSEE